MMLLVGGLSATTSVRRGMTAQYYDSLAREVAEAGILYARSCIDANLAAGASTGWGYNTTTNLVTGNACTGAFPSGVNCTSTPTSTPNQCYIVYDTTSTPRIRTRFEVSPLRIDLGGTYVLVSKGIVELYNTAGTLISPTYTYVQQQTVSTDPHVGLATGNDTSCSIQYAKLYCWGRNDSGQVGNGTTTALVSGKGGVQSPVLISGGLANKNVHAVATGIDHTCAVTGPLPNPQGTVKFSDNSYTKIYCWGSNAIGQYGNPSWTEVTAPSDSRVLNMTDHYATAISGRDFNCVLAPSVTDVGVVHVYCWGENNQKQAGRSANCTTASNADTPNPKSAFGCAIRWNNGTNAALETNQQITAVTNGTACGVLAQEGDIAWCIGNGSQGGLGNGQTDEDLPRASRVRINADTVLTGVSKVATNNGRACAIATYGSPANLPKLFCWGANWDSVGGGPARYQIDARFSALRYAYAQQMQTNRSDTTYVFYTKAVTDFAISDWNTCFIVAGEVYCAGYNDEGQLGQGHTNGPDGNPSVAGGAATAGSQVRSIEWAAKVQGLLAGKTVVSIVGGNNHFCAATSDNEVYCWGSNDFGQLGDGTLVDRSSPVQAAVPKNIVY